jgi:hypothetical protein
MVDAKQLMTRVLSWFRPGAVRPVVVCSGTILLSTGVPEVGLLQASGLEGAAGVDPYGMQWLVWWRPVPARFTVPVLLLQHPAWGCTRGGSRHAVDSGRDGVPPA